MDSKVIRFWIWAAILTVVGIVGASWYTDDGKGYYQHMAEQEISRCINSGGVDTGWRGSSGISLENFCNLHGTSKALTKQCHDHPETC